MSSERKTRKRKQSVIEERSNTQNVHKSPKTNPTNNITLTKEMRKLRQIKAKKVIGEEWKTKETIKSTDKQKSGTVRKNKQNENQNKLPRLSTVVLKQASPNKKSRNVKQTIKRKITKVKKDESTSRIGLLTVNATQQKKQAKGIKSWLEQAPKTRNANKSTKTLENSAIYSNKIGNLNAEKDATEKADDIYEFTYDPKEEPPPLKKKKTVRKKPIKPKPPKAYFYNNNYDKNVSKALCTLKRVIASKSKQNNEQRHITDNEQTANNEACRKSIENTNTVHPSPQTKQQITNLLNNNCQKNMNKNQPEVTTLGNTITNKSVSNQINTPALTNYNSMRIEDIAADFEMSDGHNDLNYSPVYSPEHQKSPNQRESGNSDNNCLPTVNSRDPLNLQEELSFFDDQPVANSSMIKSIRNPAPSPRDPLASPWRVEFGCLPIKWQINTYIKPNMTPAVESSFIAENTKQHVYTNIVPQSNESLPQIFDKNTSAMKQPSIISFIKEMAEKSAKKKRGRSVSPTKANSLFEETINSHTNMCTSVNLNAVTPTKNTEINVQSTPQSIEVVASPLKTITNLSNKENSNRNKEKENKLKGKSSRKQNKDKDRTYFGFDDTDEQDQENVSPIKVIQNNRVTALRPRSRAVLQDINCIRGTLRAALHAKSNTIASSDAVKRRNAEELKSAEEAPVFSEKGIVENPQTVVEATDGGNDDNESVHLFEDFDVVHHLKPQRKSYGKPKKVMFSRTSVSGVDNEHSDEEYAENYEDDLADLNFSMAIIEEKKSKKKKIKKLRSRKEEKEADEWAAAFNSMCEDVDQFPLVVE
ncbi:uncharacterized protein MAL13P1.304 [Bombyx mandarina]|uniref:Uncharacterized protein MAL13P1.304 n=1 Tax=Bombyx mandarina TaxID=7092 RepID=A0A6J2JY19_BOMMA|nr:uncharacterized protein MAL13P1.304 [Bombyx mandarina]